MTPVLPTPDSAPMPARAPAAPRPFSLSAVFYGSSMRLEVLTVFLVLMGFCGLFTLSVFVYPALGENLDEEARAILQLRANLDYIHQFLTPAGVPLAGRADNVAARENVLAKIRAMAAPVRLIRQAGRSGFLLIDHAADRKKREEFSSEMGASLSSLQELTVQRWAGSKPSLDLEAIDRKIQALLDGYQRYHDSLRAYQVRQFKWTALIRGVLIVFFLGATYYWARRYKRFQTNQQRELQGAVEQQTAQIKIQAQLQKEQAESLRLIYQGSRDAIATIDARTKRFSSCNAAALALFGIPTEAEFCEQLPGALSPEYQPDGRRSDETSTQVITRAFKEGSLTFEWLWKRRDGTTFWGLTTLDRLQEGSQFFLLGTLRDLTAQREFNRLAKVHQEEMAAAAIRIATSEAHYRALFEHTIDPIGTVDPVTLRFKTANPALLKLFGLPSEAALFALPDGALSPEFQPDGSPSLDVARQIQRKNNGLPYSSQEWFYKKSDGCIFPARVTQVRIMISGTPLIIVTIQDLTLERVAAEQERADKQQLASQAKQLEKIADELKASQEHYRAIFDHTADTVGTIDPLTARYTSCNPASLALFGVSSEADFLATPPGGLSPALQPDGQSSAVKAAALFKQMLTQDYYTGEWLFKRADGNEFLAQITFARVHIREKVFILATVRDLTLQKEVERAQQLQTSDLRQLAQEHQQQFQLSENRYRSLVDASPEAILVVAQSGNIELVNPAAALLFGYSLSELISQQIERLIPSAFAKSHAALRADFQEAPAQRTMARGAIEINARRKNGSEFPAEVSLSPVQSPFGPQVICVVRDVSANKQAALQMAALLEQEKNISQMKTRFISLTSHEFRTPMAAAMGSVEILTHHLDRLDQAKRQALLVRITASLQHMNRMLDDILLLNRADASRVDIRLRTLNLGQELRSILQESELGDSEQHSFHYAATAEVPEFVSDPSLLQHIFSNLLSNAVRYSPAGTTITLRLTLTAEAAVVEVADQGIGIPLADHERIFEPFERGSNIGQIAGTGLGLNIVRRMVELLRGTVVVSSLAGGGTNFTVVLPRIDAPTQPS